VASTNRKRVQDTVFDTASVYNGQVHTSVHQGEYLLRHVRKWTKQVKNTQPQINNSSAFTTFRCLEIRLSRHVYWPRVSFFSQTFVARSHKYLAYQLHTRRETHRHAEIRTHTDTQRQAQTRRETHRHAHTQTSTITQRDAQTRRDTHTETRRHTETRTDTQRHVQTSRDTHRHSETRKNFSGLRIFFAWDLCYAPPYAGATSIVSQVPV
jgi:hypothetical protein